MWTHVDGKEGLNLKLYALSTCGWCKKTKKLLNDLGVSYDYVFVDTLTDEEQDEITIEMEKYVSDISFPLIVINDGNCIQGFKEDEIKGAIND